MKITQERMNALLDQFTKATNQKQYKRIPYVDWKRLKTMDTCFAEIVSDPLTGQISVVLTSKKAIFSQHLRQMTKVLANSF